MTALERLRASTTGVPAAYTGLIKHSDKIIWSCPHKHRNRDQDTRHTAARRCAKLVLSALIDPEKTRSTIEAMRHGQPHFQHGWQAKEWKWSLERYEWALQAAGELRSSLSAWKRTDEVTCRACGAHPILYRYRAAFDGVEFKCEGCKRAWPGEAP